MLPVLITFFNRPNTLRRVLESVSARQDLEVYFASDGPRNLEDRLNLDRCWELVDHYFPGTPNTRKLNRAANSGCRLAMTDNITWFFDLVDYGAILEDDCVPNSNFFKMQSYFLENSDYAKRFISISGSRVVIPGRESAHLKSTPSIFPMVWGWGTWANSWAKYELEITDAEEISEKISRKLFPSQRQWLKRRLFEDTFNSRFHEVNIGYINTWDYSLTATAWRENLPSIHLSSNSIINIGFNSQGTHTISTAPRWVPKMFESTEPNWSRVGDWDPSLDVEIARHVFNTGVIDFSKNRIKKLLLK